jgi:uncharacterized protein YjiK
MPEKLVEISAISFYKKSQLICVQDEAGKVFIYDLKKTEVKDGINFGKKGDYEGIAEVNDTIYVLSSNGKLHQITHFDLPDQKTKEIQTQLDGKNDTEGLCYDEKHHRLLIACKQNPGNNLKGVRAVYAFDLMSMSLSKNPVYTVSLDELKRYLFEHEKEKFAGQEIKNIFEGKGDVTFQPSEIATHPITHDVYLISTVGKLMVVLNEDGKIKFIKSLGESEFKQPEGLCFAKNGTMYISDEGRSGNGNILQFKYQPNENK